MTKTAKEYLAGTARWRNPRVEKPPRGVKINLLTEGGIQITGNWDDESGYIAWSRLIAIEEEDKAWIEENRSIARTQRIIRQARRVEAREQ